MPDGEIIFKPIKVRVAGQAEGRLAFVDDALVAVLVKLDETHGALSGRWYAEAAFNSLERMDEVTFETLDEAAEWIKSWLDKH